ncbi:hypothetical protein ACQCN2_09175 [Brevibacillus ginsengisoli]|uniref:hypothetical protein n=1 Tax=Brevibacillus ginsengisoli TaxID=363854 RepID=UPI003CE91975
MSTIIDLNSSVKDTKKQMLKDLLDVLDHVPDEDHPSAIKQLIAYLNGLLRVKLVIPPTTEIMSLIKCQKPKLYQATRRSVTSTSHLKMLFLIDMDPTTATNRIKEFANSV